MEYLDTIGSISSILSLIVSIIIGTKVYKIGKQLNNSKNVTQNNNIVGGNLSGKSISK